MTNHVRLNNVDHANLRVAIGQAAAFGDAVNEVVVFPTEFEEVQREYPILFRRDEAGVFHALALLGFDRDENLFLDKDGWQGRYVPALLQRGPFLIGVEEQLIEGERRRAPMIHIDLDDARVGADNGAAVFLSHGGNAPYLDHIIRVLQVIHDGVDLKEPMFAAFAEADLIEPVLLQISLDETTRYDLPDCYTIGAERLARLDASALDRLHRAGFLRTAFMVASSLGNIARLIDLKNARRGAA